MKIARRLFDGPVSLSGKLLICVPTRPLFTANEVGRTPTGQGLLSYARRYSYSPIGFVGHTTSRRTRLLPAQVPDAKKKALRTT
jgi:hypothetical protein